MTENRIAINPPDEHLAVAHIVRGNGVGEELILCGLNGWLRELPFPVSTCTDYRERAERGAGLVGFGAGV